MLKKMTKIQKTDFQRKINKTQDTQYYMKVQRLHIKPCFTYKNAFTYKSLLLLRKIKFLELFSFHGV